MKTKICVMSLSVIFLISAAASIYLYPKENRPQIDLIEACTIAGKVLKVCDFDTDSYYIVGASLSGKLEEAVWVGGTWGIEFSNKKGDKLTASIPFPSGDLIISLQPRPFVPETEKFFQLSRDSIK